MNERHLQMLASPQWAEMLERNLLPWVDSVADLGDDVLEVGPGPGLTTDLLRRRTAQVTALEVDDGLAAALAERLAGTNVEVLHRSGAESGLPDSRFSAAACFAVLHHVETPAMQDRIFAEILRVLRPGAWLMASEGYDDEGTRAGHVDDLFVPVNPDLLPERLAGIGYCQVTIDHGEYDFRFAARKPV